jgi:hypothetical protein
MTDEARQVLRRQEDEAAIGMVNANPRATGEANDPESLIDYVIHQYGLTRDQARDIVREHGSDREMVDAMAGKVKAARKP